MKKNHKGSIEVCVRVWNAPGEETTYFKPRLFLNLPYTPPTALHGAEFQGSALQFDAHWRESALRLMRDRLNLFIGGLLPKGPGGDDFLRARDDLYSRIVRAVGPDRMRQYPGEAAELKAGLKKDFNLDLSVSVMWADSKEAL